MNDPSAASASAPSGTSDSVRAIGVALRGLSRTFSTSPPVEALRSIDLDLEPASFTALIGPSGCGKTTILRILAGLDHPSAGGFEFLPPARPRLGYCFQEPRLLPWRSVAANVALPLELDGVDRAVRRRRADAAIERVDLAGFAEAMPATLSGGMRMRAAVARALVAEPQMLLLDEPFGALDEVARYRLDEMLHGLWQRDRFTALLVTHSIPEAVFLAQRVVVLSPRPGRIIGEVEIDLPERTPAIRGTDQFSRLVQQVYLLLLETIGDAS